MNGRNNVGSSHNRYRPETKVPALLRVWRRIGGARRHRFAPSGTSTLHDSVALFYTAARRRSRTAVADSAGPAGDRRTTQERRSCRDDSSDAIRKLQLYIRPGYRRGLDVARWPGSCWPGRVAGSQNHVAAHGLGDLCAQSVSKVALASISVRMPKPWSARPARVRSRACSGHRGSDGARATYGRFFRWFDGVEASSSLAARFPESGQGEEELLHVLLVQGFVGVSQALLEAAGDDRETGPV